MIAKLFVVFLVTDYEVVGVLSLVVEIPLRIVPGIRECSDVSWSQKIGQGAKVYSTG